MDGIQNTTQGVGQESSAGLNDGYKLSIQFRSDGGGREGSSINMEKIAKVAKKALETRTINIEEVVPTDPTGLKVTVCSTNLEMLEEFAEAFVPPVVNPPLSTLETALSLLTTLSEMKDTIEITQPSDFVASQRRETAIRCSDPLEETLFILPEGGNPEDGNIGFSPIFEARRRCCRNHRPRLRRSRSLAL